MSDPKPPATQLHVVLVVVYVIGIIAVMDASGLIYLVHTNADKSGIGNVQSLALAALSYLAGLLSNPRTPPPDPPATSTQTQLSTP